jgi:hypothetical protein
MTKNNAQNFFIFAPRLQNLTAGRARGVPAETQGEMGIKGA